MFWNKYNSSSSVEYKLQFMKLQRRKLMPCIFNRKSMFLMTMCMCYSNQTFTLHYTLKYICSKENRTGLIIVFIACSISEDIRRYCLQTGNLLLMLARECHLLKTSKFKSEMRVKIQLIGLKEIYDKWKDIAFFLRKMSSS